MALKTINSFQLTPDWRYGGSTAKLRLYYSESFVDNEQRVIVGGAVGSSGFYKEVDITIASFVATVASFSLVTTEDSDHPNAKVTGVLYDSTGAIRDVLFEWSVPSNSTIASPAAFATMEAYNDRRSPLNLPVFYQTQSQVVALVNTMLAALGIGPATPTVRGLVKISAAAADPIAWEQGDPNARDAQKLKGVNLDALMASPANTNVPVYDAATQTWKPGVGVQGAAGGDLSGTYPNPSVVDDSHFHSALTLTSAPAHKASHENNGSDEISVAGLSGLLADPQTPSTHASSHISGGSDAFTSAQLLEAVVKRIQTSTGPTNLTVGAVSDGEFLKRDGSNIVSGVPTGTGYSVVEDEGTPVTQRSTLNFTGAGVSAVDSGGKTVVTIAGASTSDPEHRQQSQVHPSTGGNIVFGVAAPGANGSASNGIDADGQWQLLTSTTALNADAGHVPNGGAFAHTRSGIRPTFFTRVKTHSTITELRCWIGLFSADPMGSDTPAGHYAAFRFSTVAGDTNWKAVTDDGGAAPTVTDTGVAHSASTVYKLRIDCSDPASIKFYINDALVATHTTNLPTTTQDLGWNTQVRNTGSTNAKAIRINRMVISTP